jgi:hypothetical protein
MYIFYFPSKLHTRVGSIFNNEKMKSNNRLTFRAVDSAMRVDISNIRPRTGNYINYTKPTSLIDKISSKYTGGTLLVAQLVEALRYKLEGRGFDSRCCHWIVSLT